MSDSIDDQLQKEIKITKDQWKNKWLLFFMVKSLKKNKIIN